MEPSHLAILFDALVVAGLSGSAVYLLALRLALRRFFRRTAASLDRPPPPVTVLKPLRGAEPDLEESLRALCRQDHPRFQILCGVARPDDPAVEVVRRLQREDARVVPDLVINETLHGGNHKVSNLINMLPHARHDLLVIADSDVQIEPGHLRRLAVATTVPGTGAVTCLYRSVPTGGWPARVEALLVNTAFLPMAILARSTEKTRYTFGATTAISRQVLAQAGGFTALRDHLADDFELGRRVAACGYRIEIAPELVRTSSAESRWGAMLAHQLRWARTYRACRPAGYFASILTHATFWSILAALRFPGPLVLLPLGLFVLRWALSAQILHGSLAERPRGADLLLLPLTDLLFTGLWGLAFLGRRVRWGDRRLRVRRDGTIYELPTRRWPPPAVAPPIDRRDQLASRARSSAAPTS